jgi:hypothetical protein
MRKKNVARSDLLFVSRICIFRGWQGFNPQYREVIPQLFRFVFRKGGLFSAWLVGPDSTTRFTKRALVEMNEKEEFFLDEGKTSGPRLANSTCLLAEPTPS